MLDAPAVYQTSRAAGMSGDRDPAVSIAQRVDWTTGFTSATDKAVLRALARWFAWRPDGTNVRPSSIDALAAKSGVPKRSVERALRRLVDRGWLQVERRGTRRRTSTYRIVIARLATHDPDRLTARVADSDARDRHSGGLEWRTGDRHNSENGPDYEQVAVPYRSEEEVQIPASSSDRDRHSGGQPALLWAEDCAVFDAWWRANYPLHNAGATALVQRADLVAFGKCRDAGFSVEELQAMAIALWQIEPGPDPHRTWIVGTDRSMRVLHHKAQFLGLVVAGVAPQQLTFGPMEPVKLTAREIQEAKEIHRRAWGNRCQHDPTHEDWRECVWEIARARHVG